MASANIDPKQYQHILDLTEKRKKLETSIKEDMEKGAKLSGVAYENHKKTLKSRGEELKALKKQIDAVDSLVDSEEARERITEKDKLQKLDIEGLLKDQKKIAEALKKLDINKAKLSSKELQKQKESLLTAGVNLDKNLDAANAIQTQVQLQDKLAGLIGQSSAGMTGLAQQAKLFVIAMAKNPIVLMLAGLVAVGKLLMSQFNLVKTINKEMGVGAFQAKTMGDEFRLTNDALKLIGQDAVGIMGELQTQFGDLDKVTPTMVAEIGVMSTFLGASSEHLVQVTGMVERLGNDSKDAGMNTIKFASALAESNKVAPGKVLADIAENSKLFAEFGQDGGENIARAAVAARRLGLDLGSVAAIADSLLDFETSIGSEMEASMLIGKQLNFNKARELALSGDLVGAAQDVVSQIGGQAELEQMNVIQRRALADSIGVSVEELSRLAGGKMTLEDPAEDVQERLNKAHGGTQAAMTVLGTKVDALKVAVIALTAIMGVSAVMKGANMFKGKGNIFRGTRVAKSTGMLDKTKGLGRAINTSRVGGAFFGQPKTGLGKAAFGQAGKGALKRIPGVSALFGGLSIAGGIKDLKAGDKQKGGKNIGQGAGAIVGGALGTFLGPVGTMVGSAVGGWVGGKLGGAIGKWRENAAKKKAAEEEFQKTQENLGLTKKEESETLIEQNEEVKTLLGRLITATENVGKNVATHVTKE
tara:strand:+ start:11600 stop:13708 length:2109 start_codon:yes stop_codon:yes gene_type:complete